jgi:hypothetical protein
LSYDDIWTQDAIAYGLLQQQRPFVHPVDRFYPCAVGGCTRPRWKALAPGRTRRTMCYQHQARQQQYGWYGGRSFRVEQYVGLRQEARKFLRQHKDHPLVVESHRAADRLLNLTAGQRPRKARSHPGLRLHRFVPRYLAARAMEACRAQGMTTEFFIAEAMAVYTALSHWHPQMLPARGGDGDPLSIQIARCIARKGRVVYGVKYGRPKPVPPGTDGMGNLATTTKKYRHLTPGLGMRWLGQKIRQDLAAILAVFDRYVMIGENVLPPQ